MKQNIIEILRPWKLFGKKKHIKANKSSILNNYKKIINLPLPPTFSLTQTSKIIIFGLAKFYLLSSEQKKSTHIILRPRDIFNYKIKIIWHIFNITFDLILYKKIYEFINYKKKFNYDYIQNLIKKLNSRILIISSTIDPVQRLWAYLARKNNLKVVCIQHGIYSSYNSLSVLEEDIIDLYFSLSKKQSKLISKSISLKKQIPLNYESFFYYKIPKKKNLRVCLIGNDYERYNREGKKRKKITLKIYNKLINILSLDKQKKFKIFYKKHPSEIELGKLQHNVDIIKKEKLNTIDIFFGVSSTLLFDLASKKKCAIQILSDDLQQDNYQKNSFCKSLSIEEIEKRGIKFLREKKVKIPCLKSKNNFNKELSKILKN